MTLRSFFPRWQFSATRQRRPRGAAPAGLPRGGDIGEGNAASGAFPRKSLRADPPLEGGGKSRSRFVGIRGGAFYPYTIPLPAPPRGRAVWGHFCWGIRTQPPNPRGTCSARASSPRSTFPGQTWFRHRHAVSILRATSSGSMYLKTPQGYRTHTDSSQPETRTKTTTSRLIRPEPESIPLMRIHVRVRR
jgi:hypothetical protein